MMPALRKGNGKDEGNVAGKGKNIVNLLPGPVAVSDEVIEAMGSEPFSHRDGTFVALHASVAARLLSMTGARNLQIMVGTGTLANDAVGAQIARLGSKGAIVSCGEFGHRLADQARRHGLVFHLLETEWGERPDAASIDSFLQSHSDAGWLWAVHGETSTGAMLDLPGLSSVCGERGVKLCLDCISTLGLSGIDLSGVYLASTVSGKGLGGLPGLALVFYDHEIEPSGSIPSYLDLGLYAKSNGIPFTHSSNLVAALSAALDSDPIGKGRRLASIAGEMRKGLAARGFRMLGLSPGLEPFSVPSSLDMPWVTTIVLDGAIDSFLVGKAMAARGFLLSYRSSYLLKRNWVQVCLMGDLDLEQVVPVPGVLAEVCASPASAKR